MAVTAADSEAVIGVAEVVAVVSTIAVVVAAWAVADVVARLLVDQNTDVSFQV